MILAYGALGVDLDFADQMTPARAGPPYPLLLGVKKSRVPSTTPFFCQFVQPGGGEVFG